MNLKDMLLEEHSKQQRDRIVRFIGADKNRFNELMKLFFGGEYRIAQRAAWPMSYVVHEHPELIEPFLDKLIGNLSEKNQHPAIIRNSVRVLQELELPSKYHGTLMDSCFNFIESNDTPAAVKAFSLTVLGNLSKYYPDIRPELKLIIEERWDHETPAFHSRARKILQTIK